MSKKFDLHVNPEPLSTAGFDARVSQCITELRPVIDRLCKRHSTTIVYAALISECGDATLAGAVRYQLNAAALDKVAERLLRTLEQAKHTVPD